MGPYCTQIMADLGADVIKLESPDGDTSRYVGPSRTKGRAGMFINLNRGKRCIVLDLRQDKGRDLCLKLAAKAHVVLHSMPKPAPQTLGLSYAALAPITPAA